jgi:hypothetical protein
MSKMLTPAYLREFHEAGRPSRKGCKADIRGEISEDSSFRLCARLPLVISFGGQVFA